MQRPECTVEARCGAAWIHLRRDLPATHDRKRQKPRHGLVLHARFRVAGPKGKAGSLASSWEFPGGWNAAATSGHGVVVMGGGELARAMIQYNDSSFSSRLLDKGRYLHEVRDCLICLPRDFCNLGP